MERGLIIGFLISLVLVSILGASFYFSKGSPSLAQVSFWQKEDFSEIKKKIENLENEISNLKKGISLIETRDLKEKLSLVEKENEELKENFEKRLDSLEKELGKVKEKKKEIKKENLCQKKENDLPKREVIFNEICWMGIEDLPSEEWIELKNISEKEIDLTDWQILNKNQRIKIIFEEGTKISPNEILVLKRGDEFSGAVKNSDEALFLFDKDCNLEDEVLAEPNWPAGDNFSKRTMERKSDFSWQTSLDPGGTPGKENSSGFVGVEKEEKTEPQISLSFPSEIPVNKEFDVSLSVSNLEDENYDLKISILKISEESEQKRTISEISLTGEEWQDSYRYLTKVFTGSSFSGDFKLRVSAKNQDFRGQAEILAKIRQSENKKISAEFREKINITQPQEIISAEIPIPVETPSQPPTPLLVSNLLSNEFFENWSAGTSGVPPDDWMWNGAASRINQSSDGFVGDYSTELTLTTSDYRGFYQYGKIMASSTTYYAQIWVKGKGVVRLGIKYPGSTYVYYGEEVIINTFEWTKIEISRQPANSGDDGGIKLNVKYDETKDIPSGSKLIIGAAWLGESPPSQNWPF